jgi:cyclomaltodextrin glucanotransferase
MAGDRAAFWRVYQDGSLRQTALVLLNKGDAPTRFEIAGMASSEWTSALDGRVRAIDAEAVAVFDVAAHGVAVWLSDMAAMPPQPQDG